LTSLLRREEEAEVEADHPLLEEDENVVPNPIDTSANEALEEVEADPLVENVNGIVDLDVMETDEEMIEDGKTEDAMSVSEMEEIEGETSDPEMSAPLERIEGETIVEERILD